jgi:hypothetical protein
MMENTNSSIDQQVRNRALRATILRGWGGMLTGGVIGTGVAMASQLGALPVLGEEVKNFDNAVPGAKEITMATCVATGAAFPSAFILGSVVAGVTAARQYPKMLKQEREAVLKERQPEEKSVNSFVNKIAEKKAQPEATLGI